MSSDLLRLNRVLVSFRVIHFLTIPILIAAVGIVLEFEGANLPAYVSYSTKRSFFPFCWGRMSDTSTAGLTS